MRKLASLATAILVFIPLKWQSKNTANNRTNSTDESDNSRKLLPPSHRYQHYRHPSEEEHRTAEQFSWRKIYRLNIGVAVAAGVAAISAAGAYCETRRQVDIARDHLTITSQPSLHLADLHIWNEGHGSPLNPDNPLPALYAGAQIRGSANVVNTGREPISIIGSNIQAVWLTHLTMNNPAWGDPGLNRCMNFVHHPPYDVENIVESLVPAGDCRWDFTLTVTQKSLAPGVKLYVIGHVAYQDRTKTSHGLYFVREYDSSMGRFETPKDAPEGYEAPN